MACLSKTSRNLASGLQALLRSWSCCTLTDTASSGKTPRGKDYLSPCKPLLMNEFKTIIVEDELHARERLKLLLSTHPQIKIVAEASTGEEGLNLISLHKPDLIFLDIQLPVLNAFEMLQKLQYAPRIIFTTAYEEFALSAFEHNSIDYLLKPFSAERLAKAVDKLHILASETSIRQLQDIATHIQFKR